jgi:AraC-like DNA-binding protein
MALHPRLPELRALVAKHTQGLCRYETAISNLSLFRFTTEQVRVPMIYTPALFIIAQGNKEVSVEKETHHYHASEYLVASVDLPVIGKVHLGEHNTPYLSVRLDLDLVLFAELMTQQQRTTDTNTKNGLFISSIDDSLMDATVRLIQLLDTPNDIAALAPMIVREIHYRLLTGEHGPMIAQIVMKGSSMQRIAQVIHAIRQDVTHTMSVEQMADMANMSPSAFYAHFKTVTMMSPLQYCKRLRLTTARQMLLTEEVDATTTAYRVGYQSVSQFSREYARMFGAPPMRDVENKRIVTPA